MRWAPVVVAVSLIAVAVGGGVGAAAGGDAEIGLALAPEFDRAQFRIAVHENGSARWTFHFERALANASERQQFEAFAADFNENQTTLYRDFRNQSRALVDQGVSATGRSMAVEAFSRRAFVSTGLNDVGVVEMSFTWTAFARTEGERVIVGDVFEGGLYLGPDQALVVRAGEGLAFEAVAPEATLSGSTLAESDTVTWTGERSFTDNRPRVVLAPPTDGGEVTAGDTAVTTAVDTTERPSVAITPGHGEAGSPVWPVVLVLAIIAAALGVFFYRRRGGTFGRPSGGAGGGVAVDETALLDDEARIKGLLEEQDGRMRQSAIVEATGWSKSKVSMVLSEMEDADQVRKLRVGRENIVSLPGHEPDAARSSLDDEE